MANKLTYKWTRTIIAIGILVLIVTICIFTLVLIGYGLFNIIKNNFWLSVKYFLCAYFLWVGICLFNDTTHEIADWLTKYMDI